MADLNATLNTSNTNGSCDKSQCNLEESLPLVRSIASSCGSFNIRSLNGSGKELRRSLGFRHAFVFIVGILFGSGIFISPGLIANQTTNMGMAILVWVISGVPCLFGALCFCELSCMYGKTGGVYLYLNEAYGNVVGFVCIWTYVVIIVPLGIAVLSLAIGNYVTQPFYDITTDTGMLLSRSIAVLALLTSAIFNCISTSFVGRLLIWFTIVQTLSVSFLVVLGAWQAVIGNTTNYKTMLDNMNAFDVGSFGIALYNGLWGYEGWGLVVAVSEELENLERNLWLSIVTGIPFVIFCYVLVNLALMAALTRDQIASSSTVATAFVENILGKKPALVIPFAVAFSTFGSINATFFMLARMLLSAAREGQLPYALSFIHRERRTPIPAVLVLFAMAVIWLLLPGTDIQGLITICSLGIWTQYFFSILSVIVMRVRKPDLKRPFKVWWINPILTSIIALFLVVIPFVNRPVQSAISLTILLSALPVYFILIKNFERLPSCLHKAIDLINQFLRRKCNLVPCIYIDKDPVSNVADVMNENSL